MTNNQLTSTHLAVKSELDGYKIHASRGQATAMAMVRLFESIDRDLEELQERRQATMNSEPVAWRRFQETPTDGGYWVLCGDKPNCSGVEPLYRHTQPAPVVPEEKSIPNTLSMYAVDAVAAIAEVKGWNACRAAMLHAGNSPAIPDGYVMVPKEPTREMLDEFDSIIDYGAEDSVDAWRRLLAAAPQEVKGE